MNFARLRWGEWIAAIAGLDLALVTFRAWYKVSGTDVKGTAWDSLTSGRYLLIATAVVGVFLLLVVASEQTEQLSFPPGIIAAVVGGACTAYVAYRLASPPTSDLDPDTGIYFGLVSALGVCLGGVLSAREGAPAPAYEAPAAEPGRQPTEPWSPTAAPADAPGAAAGTWSPAAPAAETTTWSPAAPATPPAAAAEGVQPGEEVTLTAGGSRFPAGTRATVVQAFAGGALVEVTAADGLSERFEVPDAAFERSGAGGGETWSPAMPAPAEPAAGAPSTEDWGFGDTAAEASSAAAPGVSEEEAGADGAAAAEKKVPFWKREIGGGKKKQPETAETEALATGAAAAAAGETAEARPGFFKRLFGGGKAPEPETEATTADGDGWTVPEEAPAGEPEAAVSGAGGVPATGPESEAPAAAELEAEPTPEPEPVAPEPEPTPEPEAATPAEPEPPAAEPEPETAAAVEPEPEPVVDVAPDEPVAAVEPEPTPEPKAAAPEPAPEPEAAAPEPPAPEPEPEAAAPAAEPEPPAPAPEPEASSAASEAAAPAADDAGDAAAEPKPRRRPSSATRNVPKELSDTAPEAAAGEDGGAGEPDASAGPPKRRRSSGSRKVPKEAVEAAGAGLPPKVGDEVELKVGGGKWDAGTRGTVVDVFSAGVIVEFADDAGRTERLDLPFEAVGPAAGA